jgi:uncharacterized protein YjeT (DUF2065 family)
MLRVKPVGAHGSLIYQPLTPSRLIGGLFSIAFGLTMLFHPQGWTNGHIQDGVKQMADPNLIRAIGTAILVFGIVLLFLKVTYFVSRNVGTVIEQWRMIVPIHSSGHALSDFSEVSVISEAARSADDSSTTFRLCLVGPAHKLCLASSRYRAVLAADRKLVENATGIRP